MNLFYRTTGPDDTHALGRALGGALNKGDSVLLKGDLGMGKSVLARGVARALGVDGPMPSPTFTLMQPYEGWRPCEGRVSVCHLDLYRLGGVDEFEAAGLYEFIGGDHVALIEWPPGGIDAAPCVALTLTRGASDDERRVKVAFCGMDAARARAVEEALAGWEERI